jgi:hypothetical protein
MAKARSAKAPVLNAPPPPPAEEAPEAVGEVGEQAQILEWSDAQGGRLGVVPAAQCRPNPWNPQSMDAITFARLKTEIAEHGIVDAITVVDMEDGTFRIIGGEHRWRASKEVGISMLPATILPLSEWDDDRQKFEVVKLNILHGDLDPRKFLPMYQDVVARYGADATRNLFAYTDERKWKELVDKMSDGVKKTLSPEAAKQFDERAKKAQTVEDLTAIVQEIFSQFGSTLDKGFMCFSYGKQKHIYVPMNVAMRRAMDRIIDWLTFTGGNLNEFLEPVLESALAKAEAEFAAQEMANGDDLF